MPAKPLTIGSLHFAKKGDAAAFLQAMLHRYDVGDKVGAADEQVLRDTLALHPEAGAKIGCGITHFSVTNIFFDVAMLIKEFINKTANFMAQKGNFARIKVVMADNN